MIFYPHPQAGVSTSTFGPIIISHTWSNIDILYYIGMPLLWAYCFAFFIIALNCTGEIELNTIAIIGLFYDTEDETGNTGDFKVVCDQMILLVTIYSCTSILLYKFPKKIAAPTVLNGMLSFIYILSIPAILSLLFGTYIMNYLRGDSDSNSILYSGIFDIANFIGFIKRFLVQFIRYILIMVKLFLFHHFTDHSIRELVWHWEMRRDALKAQSYILDFMFQVDSIFIYTMHYTAEIVNILIVYYAQFGAFVIILFWLLKALFSTAWPMTKYFWMKRQEKNKRKWGEI